MAGLSRKTEARLKEFTSIREIINMKTKRMGWYKCAVSPGVGVKNKPVKRHNYLQFYHRIQPCDKADFLKNLNISNFALFVVFSI